MMMATLKHLVHRLFESQQHAIDRLENIESEHKEIKRRLSEIGHHTDTLSDLVRDMRVPNDHDK
jgi:hypothetical protein